MALSLSFYISKLGPKYSPKQLIAPHYGEFPSSHLKMQTAQIVGDATASVPSLLKGVETQPYLWKPQSLQRQSSPLFLS